MKIRQWQSSIFEWIRQTVQRGSSNTHHKRTKILLSP